MRRACALLLALSAGCGDGTSCETGTADMGEVCLPGRIAPDVPVTLEVRELCGRGCTEPPGCSAIFRGAQVILDVEQEVCVDTLTPACLKPGLPGASHHLQAPGAAAGRLGALDSRRSAAPAARAGGRRRVVPLHAGRSGAVTRRAC
jgi:hypothetical protein